MDDRFFEAWITKRWRVLHRKLQPLCLGHVINLAAAQSPFALCADTNQEITPADLLIAVKICAEKWPFPGEIRFGISDALWILIMRISPKIFHFHLALFIAYRNDYCSFPEFYENELSGGGGVLTAPMPLSKAAYLMANTSISEERAFSMPLARVDYIIAAIEERKSGEIRFVDENEFPEEEFPEENEKEVIARARKELPAARFEQWLAARKEGSK